jgi:hypothetical protein
MVANQFNTFRLANVEITLQQRPLFYVEDHYVSLLGLMASAGFFATGLFIGRFLHPKRCRSGSG